MEAIQNLLRRRVHEHDRKLDDLVQIGPRVLFASTFEVQHTNYLRGGSNWWWRRSSQRLRDSIAHQVDYAMYWGATEASEPGCKVSDLIAATDCNTTHVRVWIESMPLA